MKAFATIGLGSLGTLTFQHSVHASRPDRPHGVAPGAWLPLDENFGVVISRSSANGAIGGYFMVKQNGAWRRFQPEHAPTQAGSSSGP